MNNPLIGSQSTCSMLENSKNKKIGCISGFHHMIQLKRRLSGVTHGLSRQSLCGFWSEGSTKIL